MPPLRTKTIVLRPSCPWFKIETIGYDISSGNHSDSNSLRTDSVQLKDFASASSKEVKQIILKSPNISCEFDPISNMVVKIICLSELFTCFDENHQLVFILGIRSKKLIKARLFKTSFKETNPRSKQS